MSLRHHRKTVPTEYYAKVKHTINSLTTNFNALKMHQLLTRDDTSPDSVASFEQILNRSIPATEAEKWISATISYICNVHRGSFISLMFKNHIPSLSQLVDGRLVSVGLAREDSLRVHIGEDGKYHVDVITGSSKEEKKEKREKYKDKRDRRDHPRKQDDRHPSTRKPAMSTETCNKILSTLPIPTKENGNTPYLNALLGSEGSGEASKQAEDSADAAKSKSTKHKPLRASEMGTSTGAGAGTETKAPMPTVETKKPEGPGKGSDASVGAPSSSPTKKIGGIGNWADVEEEDAVESGPDLTASRESADDYLQDLLGEEKPAGD